MILALAASLAIVVLDHTSLRASPRSNAAELTALWQGDVLEVRGERAGYLKVYDYRRERGGYIKSESVRPVELTEAAAPELLAVVRRIENRGALETAHRALGNCGQVFRYAVATGRAMRDPCGDLRGALPPVQAEHFAATTEPKRVAELLRAMDGYQGTLTVRCALRLAPLVFVRPGELRKAEWADIDLDAAEWRYTVTKTKTPHIVPLSGRPWTSCANCIPSPGGGALFFRERGATAGR